MRTRIIIPFLIFSIVLLAANGFVCATWSHFSGHQGWILWQLIPALVTFSFIPITILGHRYSNVVLRLVYLILAIWLGVLNYTFFASLGYWVIEGVAWLTGWHIDQSEVGAVLFGMAILACGYGMINAAWIRITRITVQLPNLPETWQKRSAVLLTDLHLGHISGPSFVQRILSSLQNLQPDIVFISGDLFDGTTAGLDRLVEPWSKFSVPLGIYYVTGNHDEFSDRKKYLDAVKRTGIHVLNNEKTIIDGMQIIGIHDSEAVDPIQLRNILQQAQINREHPSILLAHQPSNLDVVEKEGISLQLSGHTHQGQFWPWNLVVQKIYGPFAYGLHYLDNLLVYTSSGVGTWGPPFRVGTKSEIVLIQFEKGNSI